MTLNEMADSGYYNSVNHYLNGKKTTQANCRYWFNRMFNGKNKVMFSMSFPDGDWLCLAEDGSWGYGVTVPDDREQEERLMKRFLMG